MRRCFGRGRPLRLAVYTACLSAFIFFGYDQGVLSGLLENDYFKETFGDPVGAKRLAPHANMWLIHTSGANDSRHYSLELL